MMKKLLSFAACVTFASMLFAQSPFIVSPSSFGGAPLMLLGEKMSQNRTYVAGTDQASQAPMMWNTITNQLIMISQVDSVWTDDWYWEVYPRTGSLHSVTNAGVAVGSIAENCGDFISYPIMVNADAEVTYLYHESGDAGAAAWGISEDGSTIVGYYFDAAWVTKACVWTNNGTVRTDLPWPTDQQVGFPVEYCSARWMSADGNVILGYAQDDNTGAWVAVCWKKQNGEYAVHSFCQNYYQTKYYDETGELVVPGNNPYFDFQPLGISANGEWVALSVLESHDPSDWDNIPLDKAARYNLTTNTFEMLSLDEEYSELLMFGISNNGTMVGRLTGMLNFDDWTQPVDGIVWKVGQSTISRLYELFPNDEYVESLNASALSDISANGEFALGYAIDANEDQTAFIVRLEEHVSIAETESEVNVYPNPATTRLVVNADDMIRCITIMDLKGQVVNTITVNSNQANIDVQNMANGMYIMNILTDNGQMSKKVSILR